MKTFGRVTASMALAASLVGSPLVAGAADLCIEVNGGPPSGVLFVGKSFRMPRRGSCKPWGGIWRTANTVVGTTSGAGCLSADGVLFTLTASTTAPQYLGSGVVRSDHIQLCPSGGTCAGGSDVTNDTTAGGGAAAIVVCDPTAASIPSSHD